MLMLITQPRTIMSVSQNVVRRPIRAFLSLEIIDAWDLRNLRVCVEGYSWALGGDERLVRYSEVMGVREVNKNKGD